MRQHLAFARRHDGKGDRSVVFTHVLKLRESFRGKAARRQCLVGHARKLNNVPGIAADWQQRDTCAVRAATYPIRDDFPII
jgi:hypothetical protein